MTGGRASRQKGNRTERALVKYLQGQGFGSERQPGSGSYGGRHAHDVLLPLLGVDRRIEVKCRADGFRELYGWLDRGPDFLVVKADRKEPLVVVPLRLAALIALAAEKGKA